MFFIFLRILEIFLMALAGWVLMRRFRFSDHFARELSIVLVNFVYPCLIVSAIVRNFTIQSLLANWMLPAGTAGILCLGWCVGRLVLPLLKNQPEPVRRCFHLTCLLNNYSFLPILIAAGLWGEKAIAQISFAALGAEVTIWTLGIKTVTGAKVDRSFIRHVLSMPILALLFAISLLGIASVWTPAAETSIHHILATLLDTAYAVGRATIPIAALVCGIRLAEIRVHHLFSPLTLGVCILRLGITPALCLLFIFLLPLPKDVAGILSVIALQPCAMLQVSLAEVYDIDADLASATVLMTHLCCLATIPIWLYGLGY